MKIEKLNEFALTIGAKETIKAIKRQAVKEVLIGYDSDSRVTHEVVSLCHEQGIPIYQDFSMEELGRAAHIKVKAAAIGVLINTR